MIVQIFKKFFEKKRIMQKMILSLCLILIIYLLGARIQINEKDNVAKSLEANSEIKCKLKK